jgi:hypothetical protein
MSTISMLRDGLRGAGVAAITVFFCAPALAGEIYSWRTEDGGYAFTDDEKAIPPRYRDQVETRATEGLGDYPRLTAPDAGASDAYSRRLADRLDHLRSLNRDLDAAHAAPPAQTGLDSLAVQTGHFNIGVPLEGEGDEPLVIEKVRFRHKSEMATRHNTVIRRGDELLAVIKGRPLISEINQAPEISEMVD